MIKEYRKKTQKYQFEIFLTSQKHAKNTKKYEFCCCFGSDSLTTSHELQILALLAILTRISQEDHPELKTIFGGESCSYCSASWPSTHFWIFSNRGLFLSQPCSCLALFSTRVWAWTRHDRLFLTTQDLVDRAMKGISGWWPLVKVTLEVAVEWSKKNRIFYVFFAILFSKHG